jgi:hypothetical protein
MLKIRSLAKQYERHIDNMILPSDTVRVDASQSQQTTETAESQSEWVKTPVANLLRYKPSGIYFVRVRIRGKLFRQTAFSADPENERDLGCEVAFG